MANFDELYTFIDRARRNRKYPDSTAQALRTSLKLYEEELSEEERLSLDIFKNNFEQITREVFNKNASKFTAGSLATYKSRVLKVIAEFEKYGDPAKMANWNPKIISRARKQKNDTTTTNSDSALVFSGTNHADQRNEYSDKGAGWILSVQSQAPMNATIKVKLIEVADLLNNLNRVSGETTDSV